MEMVTNGMKTLKLLRLAWWCFIPATYLVLCFTRLLFYRTSQHICKSCNLLYSYYCVETKSFTSVAYGIFILILHAMLNLKMFQLKYTLKCQLKKVLK